MSTEEIITRTGKACLGEDGIVRVTNLPRGVQTLADAQENMAAIAQLCAGRPRPILVDLRQVTSIDLSARQHYLQRMPQLNRAVALLVASPLSRVIGNAFFRLKRAAVPIHVFTDEDEALAWLRTFLE